MRIVFIGTGEIGVPTLRALQKSEHELVGIVTQPDKPVGRAQKITAPPIKAALAGSKMSILQPARIKDREAIEQIRALAPDIIVVVAYGQILPRAILEIPKIACLNLHASLLPRWRGAAPIQAAIAAGDRETGMTVMYMDEGLDTGDILLQRKIDISPSETGATLHDRLAEIAPETLLESLRLLAGGNAPRIPQDKALATSAPKLDRDDGRIDWRKSAELIERQIRAYTPWPGAFALVSEKSGRELKLKILAAEIVDQDGRPGEVLCADNRGLIVAAGEKSLSLYKVLLEGKWPMNGQDFIRGHARLLEGKLK
ncbi:MAG TPA: methionyl-tRNA formyltransferase [Chthoniobacterales bacterium]|nr:methionyl-tRNA formyltransferase [Chthoniobacterales bacterium]